MNPDYCHHYEKTLELVQDPEARFALKSAHDLCIKQAEQEIYEKISKKIKDNKIALHSRRNFDFCIGWHAALDSCVHKIRKLKDEVNNG